MNVNAADVMRIVENPGATKLVDVRTPQEYNAGHIPGAVNIPYPRNGRQSPTIATDQRNAYEAVGIMPDDPVVLYCQSGVRAQAAADALAQAGYRDVDVYPGSWADWSAVPSRPREK